MSKENSVFSKNSQTIKLSLNLFVIGVNKNSQEK